MTQNMSKLGAKLIAIMGVLLLLYHSYMGSTNFTLGEITLFAMQCGTLMLWGMYENDR